jgi:hypothetical protein
MGEREREERETPRQREDGKNGEQKNGGRAFFAHTFFSVRLVGEKENERARSLSLSSEPLFTAGMGRHAAAAALRLASQASRWERTKGRE